MTLYEIDERLQNCWLTEDGDVVDVETGEILNIEYLDNLVMKRQEKIHNIMCWIKDLEAFADQLGQEISVMQKRKKDKVNKAEQLRKYLQKYLHGEKYEDTDGAIGYRTVRDKVVIDDLYQLPDDYIKGIHDFTPSEREKMVMKTKIKKDIKAGTLIRGAHLEDSVSMQIK